MKIKEKFSMQIVLEKEQHRLASKWCEENESTLTLQVRKLIKELADKQLNKEMKLNECS